MKRLSWLVPSPSMIVALLALVLVGSGSAVAATMITSAQIKDHTIKVRDISPKAVAALAGKTGPQGPQGAPGPQGDQGPAGAARGWAVVQPNGGVMSKAGTFQHLVITRLSAGLYCLGDDGTSIGLGNYDPVLVTPHGPDATKLVTAVNTEYGSSCNPYGGHSVSISNLAGTPTDAFFVIALM